MTDLRLISRVRDLVRNPLLRELLAWCLPALLAGYLVRAALTRELPYGYYQSDTPDFLTTPDRLLFEHRFELHMKKTFLAPVLFTLPFLLHIPALIAIPVMQHILGLVLVILIGALCRMWFVHWKWFILPLTFVVALNPAMIWFEHTLMAETLFLFCTVLLAVSGTLYVRNPTRSRFIFLCIALVVEAGARPEGKLLFGFGILLVAIVHWREWRERLARFAIMLALAVTTHFLTKTSQAGLLLYTSVARLTPSHLLTAPGIEPYIAGERDALQQRWDELRLFPKVTNRRTISDSVEQYLRDQQATRLGDRHRSVNSLCSKLAIETCVRRLTALPAHVYWKFRLTANDSPSGLFDEKWLWDEQYGAYADQSDRALRLSRGLTGKPLERIEEWREFIHTHYSGVHWFNELSARWFAIMNAWRLPDTTLESSATPPTSVIHRGIPLPFLLAAAGLIAVALRQGPLRPLHLAWGLALAGFFFAIILTANVKPRFRFVFEPFWFLYIALLADSLWLGLIATWKRSRRRD